MFLNSPLFSRIFTYDFYEYLNIAPFQFNGKPNSQALFGINTMEIYLQLGNLTNAWSQNLHEANITGGNLSVSASVGTNSSTDATMLFCYLTPNMLQAVPERNVYSYCDLVPYITQISGDIAPGSPASTIESNAIQTRVVPDRVWLYIKRRKNTFTYLDSDSYCSIQSVKFNFENSQSLLAGAKQAQLYEMCVDNGLQDAFTVWKDKVGSVCCFSFGKDIELSPSLSPGVQGTFNFSVSVTFTNISTSEADDNATVENADGRNYVAPGQGAQIGVAPRDQTTLLSASAGIIAPVDAAQIKWDLYVILQNKGVISLENNTCEIRTGVVTEQDVINAGKPSLTVQEVQAQEGEGGASLGGGVGNLVKLGTTTMRSIADIGDAVVPLIGNGYSGSAKMGSAKMGSGGDLMKGYGSIGGQRISKAQLRHMAQH